MKVQLSSVKIKATVGDANAINRKGQMPPSSNAFVPSVVGLICASYVVNDIFKRCSYHKNWDKGTQSNNKH